MLAYKVRRRPNTTSDAVFLNLWQKLATISVVNLIHGQGDLVYCYAGRCAGRHTNTIVFEQFSVKPLTPKTETTIGFVELNTFSFGRAYSKNENSPQAARQSPWPKLSRRAQFSFSETGKPRVRRGWWRGSELLHLLDGPEGKFQPLRETPGGYFNPAFSPDGKRLALEIIDGARRDIWGYE